MLDLAEFESVLAKLHLQKGQTSRAREPLQSAISRFRDLNRLDRANNLQAQLNTLHAQVVKLGPTRQILNINPRTGNPIAFDTRKPYIGPV